MNKRSIISLLLAVLMIIGAFPMTAFAADTDTLDTAERDELPFVAARGDITPTGVKTVTAVNMSVIAPTVGSSPYYSATVPNGSGYVVYKGRDDSTRLNGVIWTDSTDSKIMSPTDTFKAGHTYTANVYISAQSGYQFSVSGGQPSVSASINGLTAQTNSIYQLSNTQYIAVYASFTLKPNENLSTLYLGVITKPAPGAAPSYTASPLNAVSNYTVDSYTNGSFKNGVSWRDATNYSYLTPGTDRFIPGHQYEVTIRVKAKPGYQFSTSTKTMIGYDNAYFNLFTAGDYTDVLVKHTYTCPESTPGKTVSGKITSYLSDTDDIKLTLTKTGETVLTAETTVKGNSATYSLEKIPNGMYALTVEKKDHVSRDYYVSVTSFGGNITLDIEILPLGDVTGDGKTNVQDCTAILRYVRKIDTDLSDYQLKCADVAGTGDDDGLGDAKVNVQDVTRILRHVRKIENLC